MIVYKVKRHYKDYETVVYENEEEFSKQDITVSSLELAEPFDYCKTDNGYYIQLISRAVIRKGTYGDFVKLVFPNLTWNNMLYYDSKKFRQMPFVWSREPREYKRVFVTARQKQFALYLSQGIDIYQAFNLCFNQKNRAKKEQYIKSILDNPNFVEYMKKEKLMDDLKDKLTIKGVDNNWLAEQLKRIVENEKSPGNLVIHAINTIRTTLSTNKDIEEEKKEKEDAAMQEMRDKFKGKIKKIG